MRHPDELGSQRTDSPQQGGAGTAGACGETTANPAAQAAGGPPWYPAAGIDGAPAARTGAEPVHEWRPARESADETWPPRDPANWRRADSWVLVCGGIAAAAAFAAAFLAAGGVAGQHPSPGAAVPAVVSQACPSAAP
jgi:hypothetical protein